MSEIADLVRDLLAERPVDDARWERLRELGLTEVGVPEESGGSGGTIVELADVVGAAAESGCGLPLAEHAVAAWAAAHVGVRPHLGTVVLVPSLPRGRLRAAVPWASQASHLVIAPLDGGLGTVATLSGARTEPGFDVAGSPLDEVDVDLDDAVDCVLSGREIAVRLATLRAVAIAGAARRAYQLTRAHVSVREQFGKPLVRIPAVGTALARARVDLLQAETAAARAVREVGRGSGLAPAAVARIVCGGAATRIAATAHQLHGALGITQEYELHSHTRLLWALRDADLPEECWAETLGELAVTGGEPYVWDKLTSASVAPS